MQTAPNKFELWPTLLMSGQDRDYMRSHYGLLRFVEGALTMAPMKNVAYLESQRSIVMGDFQGIVGYFGL